MLPTRAHGSRKPPWWRRLTLLNVLIFTAPPMVAALYLFGAACLSYHGIHQYDDWWSGRFTNVGSTARTRVKMALATPRISDLRNRISAEPETHEALRLQVDRGLWSTISSDVPAHWGEWIPAALMRGGELHEVEVRFRGDSSAHWTNAKKSLAIKTKKGGLYKGYRRLNFTVKSVIGQYMVASFAKDFDLLCSVPGVVPIFVNEEFYGLHRFIERPDESFLRRNGRMPGNVFRGDAALRGDYFKNLPRELFLNPYIWDRTASNDRPGATGDRALFELVAELNTSTFEEHRKFMSRFDRNELSRLLALMLAMGDTHHMSGIHNQFWYEDPSSGKLHPIVWDLMLQRLQYPIYLTEIHRFWQAALRDPHLFDETLAVLDSWIQDDRLLTVARRRGEQLEANFGPHVAYERLRFGAIPTVVKPMMNVRVIGDNLLELERRIQDTAVSVGDTALADGSNLLDILVQGHVGSELRGLVVEVDGAHEVRVLADRNLSGKADPGDRSIAAVATPVADGVRLTLERPEWLLSGCTGSGPKLVPEPLHYRFFVSAFDESGAPVAVTSVRPELHARYRDEPVEPDHLAADTALPSTRSWHPWQYAAPPADDVRLSGEVRLTEDLVIDAGSTLTIEPGTTLRLDPDVSILARGRVLARGDEARPIEIVNAVPLAPWGVFALQGAGASASRFEHVSFTGGGGARLERVEYKGSVCVHNAREVVFENCAFAANMRCDDLLNAVRADVDLIGCSFDEANADSIDYDMSTGDIRECRITDSGNDGIDLMTCSPRILSTVITDSGDKGISVGEDSAPLVFDCEISGCVVGMEVKDMSTPVVLNTTIENNEIGLLQRHKNWRYPSAGRAKLIDTRLAGNGVDYQGLDGAQLTRAVDGSWMRSRFGFAPSTSGAPEAGEPGPWTEVAPARVVAQWSPVERFIDSTDGWRHFGRVRRLLVDERDLVASLRTGEGAIGTFVDWELTDDRVRHVLVLECAAKQLAEGRVTLATDDGELSRPLVLGADPSISSYTVVELAPGHYTVLTLAASTDERSGELRLHGWTLLALPAEEP